MHMCFCLAEEALILNRDGHVGSAHQSIANATTISPNVPTAMIVLVVVSIVGSAELVHSAGLAALSRPPHAAFRSRCLRKTAGRNIFGTEDTCGHPRDIVPRDADVFELPVVQAAELADGAVPLPAADNSQEELAYSHSWRARCRDSTGSSGWMFDYGHVVLLHDHPTRVIGDRRC